MVAGLPDIHKKDEGICKGCAQGKNVKKQFPSNKSKAKEILEIVHSDVCGPMSSNSLSEYAYYVYFVDDYSHKNWIYFLKIKDEVSSNFKEFKSLVENHAERKINILRSENGIDLTSEEFKYLV